jgi:hypothetical protein
MPWPPPIQSVTKPRGADGDGAEIRRRHILQRSAKRADRCSDRFGNHHRA